MGTILGGRCMLTRDNKTMLEKAIMAKIRGICWLFFLAVNILKNTKGIRKDMFLMISFKKPQKLCVKLDIITRIVGYSLGFIKGKELV